MTTVLITGVGAIIGYGLLQSLRKAKPCVRLIGSDIFPDAIGQIWCDSFEKSPYTSSNDYLKWITDIVKKHKIDLIIPGIEQDVHWFANNPNAFNEINCKIALNNIKLISLTGDKWKMHQELAKIGDDTIIPSFITGSYETLVSSCGSPFILKPRSSYASKGLIRISNAIQFQQYQNQLGDKLMAQPIIGTDDQEYTVAVFGDGKGGIPCKIFMKRSLAQDGSTAKARIYQDTTLDAVVNRLSAYFKPIGPTNLQFRRDDISWKLLEINPRISSTSSIRTAFGYNEAAMCVDYFLKAELPCQPIIRSGSAIRYIKDHINYDDGNSF